LGKVLLQMGELEQALSLIRESTEIRLRLDDLNIGVNYQAMGIYYEKYGDYKAAMEQYHLAHGFFQRYQPSKLPELKRQILRVNILALHEKLVEQLKQLLIRR
jgi:tetratricopeptide (TPR) repeat protein